ncbi:MAG: FAD-dependent oxidoreductase [Phycisphaeraceae bacterium]|nr:FAD-dependent oxidoreductase [Phycisphaeraceae bacterium]
MTLAGPVKLDAVIFGGGAAGLWLLDDLRRFGYRALLLECAALGAGQTIASQGIIHGGLKYSLGGLLTESAEAVAKMPELWRRCLEGRDQPDLSDTRIRADACHIWRTRSLRSWLGFSGAKVSLRVRPQKIEKTVWPAALRGASSVMRIEEPVIDPASFLHGLFQANRSRVLRIDEQTGLEFTFKKTKKNGGVDTVLMRSPANGTRMVLRPRHVILAAGQGNEDLRRRLNLPGGTMQRRGVQMVVARGKLPAVFGHCVDGARTRVTITTIDNFHGETVWQIGGKVSEDGVNMGPTELIRHAIKELHHTLPAVDLSAVEWTTYKIDKAEAATPGKRRPDHEHAAIDGNIVTAWPTKLVLAPVLARRIVDMIGKPAGHNVSHGSGVWLRESSGETWTSAADDHDPDYPDQVLAEWPRPRVAAPPWELATKWYTNP